MYVCSCASMWLRVRVITCVPRLRTYVLTRALLCSHVCMVPSHVCSHAYVHLGPFARLLCPGNLAPRSEERVPAWSPGPFPMGSRGGGAGVLVRNRVCSRAQSCVGVGCGCSWCSRTHTRTHTLTDKRPGAAVLGKKRRGWGVVRPPCREAPRMFPTGLQSTPPSSAARELRRQPSSPGSRGLHSTTVTGWSCY